MQDIDESPWDDSPSGGTTHAAEAEWTRLSSGFQNVSSPSLNPSLPLPRKTTNLLLDKSQAGYREGITAGKDGALQEGFDTGFAQTGGPLGRELGLLRGVASALLLHLSRTRTQHEHEERHAESVSVSGTSANVREIVDALAAVRFADIAPTPPLHEEAEAEGQTTHCVEGVEDLKSRRDDDGGREEGRETSPCPRSDGLGSVVTTIEDVRALRVKLETLLCESGLKIDLNLEIF
jgi:Essential protein Yae1, N terminal